jgi:hypothetical protein
MVVVENITKVSHFISLKTTHKAKYVVDTFMMEVSQLHIIPKTIVFDRDPKFTSNVSQGLFKGFIMNLNFCTTYHAESGG